jgi:hypothetical protein
MHLADISLFLACAMSLAVFDVTPVIENGSAVLPEVQYTSGTIRWVEEHGYLGAL